MYSLIETAKESGINPYDYLVWVLKAAPDMELSQNPEMADQLLPIRFQEGEAVNGKMLILKDDTLRKVLFRLEPIAEQTPTCFLHML